MESEKSDHDLENRQILATPESIKCSYDNKNMNNYSDNELAYKISKPEIKLTKAVNTTKYEMRSSSKSEKSHTSFEGDSVKVNTTANRVFSDMTNLVRDQTLNEASAKMNNLFIGKP